VWDHFGVTWNPVSYWRAVRAFRQVEANQDARIPPELRPPPGRWLVPDDVATISVLLAGAHDRQEALTAVCQLVGYDDRPEQPAPGSLALRRDEGGIERVVVLVGAYEVGDLDEGDTKELRDRIEAERERGKALWVSVFLGIDANGYFAEVALALASDCHQE
jgi:hypothetical protein